MEKHIQDQKIAQVPVTIDGIKKWLRQDLLSINSLVVTLLKDDEMRNAIAERMYANFLEDQAKQKQDAEQSTPAL